MLPCETTIRLHQIGVSACMRSWVSVCLTASAHVQNKSRIDIGRLKRLSGAFSNYTVEGLTASSAPVVPAGPRQPAPALDKTTAEALKLVFRTEGSYAQVRAVVHDRSIASVQFARRGARLGFHLRSASAYHLETATARDGLMDMHCQRRSQQMNWLPPLCEAERCSSVRYGDNSVRGAEHSLGKSLHESTRWHWRDVTWHG